MLVRVIDKKLTTYGEIVNVDPYDDCENGMMYYYADGHNVYYSEGTYHSGLKRYGYFDDELEMV